MKLLTVQEMITMVSHRWQEQYPEKQWARDPEKGEIYRLLCALADTATAEDVAAIIGNPSWTRLTCDECGKDQDRVVRVGQEPGEESQTATMCCECLEKAVALAHA